MVKYFMKEKKLFFVSICFVILSAVVEVLLAFVIKMVADSSKFLDLKVLYINIINEILMCIRADKKQSLKYHFMTQ